MKKFSQWLFDNDVKQSTLAKILGISTTTMHCMVKKDLIPTLMVAYEVEKYTKGEITVYDWLPEKTEKNPKNKMPTKAKTIRKKK